MNPFTTTIPKLENVTEKYKFISTAQFIEDVTSLGYKLESTRQPRRGLGMHSMAFSHSSLPKLQGIDLRLLATNSHDATSAFRLHIQVGVNVCANILTAFVPELAASARIVHRGYALDKVANAVDAVRNRIDYVINTMQKMQSHNPTSAQGSKFIHQASELRDAKPFRILDLQRVQHNEQADNTAWNIFNRVQESIIKGGYETIELAQYDIPRYNIVKGMQIPGRKAREMTSIRELVQTNYKLWELAVETLIKDN